MQKTIWETSNAGDRGIEDGSVESSNTDAEGFVLVKAMVHKMERLG